jgi:hypothetical protein
MSRSSMGMSLVRKGRGMASWIVVGFLDISFNKLSMNLS